MKYADPHACPACRGTIAGDARCPHCDFPLGSAPSHRLWTLLLEADRLVAQGRALQEEPAVQPVGASAPASPRPTAPHPASAPGPRHVPHPPAAASWSTGSVLLALGAVCLVVAGLIFTTVAWGIVGILGRVLILLVVTGVFGAGAAWATRRGLFGAAEALWSVFLGLITVDVLAAVAEGLFGLAWGDFAGVSVFWTIVMVGTAVPVVRWARRSHDHELVTPQLAAGVAPWVCAPAVTARLGEEFGSFELLFWAALLALVVPIVVAVVAQRAGLRWTLWMSGAAAAGLAALLVVLAVTAAGADTPIVTAVEALPALVLVAVVVLASRLVTPLGAWLVAAAVLIALYLLGMAVAGGAWHLGVNRSAGMVAVSLAVAALAWGALRREGAAWVGLRWGAVVAAFAPLFWLIAVSITNVDRVETAAWLSSPPDVWVRPAEVEFQQGAWVLAVTAPVLLAWVAVRRWRSPVLVVPQWWSPAAQLVAGLAVITAVASTLLPYLAHAAVLVVVGATLAVGLRGAPWPVVLVPPAVVAFAVVVVPGDADVTAWAWGLAAAGLSVCALVGFDDVVTARRAVSAVATGLAAGALVGTVGQVLTLSGVPSQWWGLVVGSVAAAVLLLTLAFDELPWHRLAFEVVAALAFLVSVTAGTVDLADVALLCTIGAVAAGLVSLLDDDRPYLRWVALGLVGSAWIARLAASGVETVEAYTAPFAIVLLAAGLWRLRADPTSRTWVVLTPGLTMALLPSLPQALVEPTSVRAALLGLVALLVLGAGVALKWGAPVGAGAAVALLLVLANIGPTAVALPRWILIALAGFVLLVVGTTWEKRVQEGRALVARLSTLR